MKPKLINNFNADNYYVYDFPNENFHVVETELGETHYIISNKGTLLNLKNLKIIKPHYDGKYYNYRIGINGNIFGYKIHRLIAFAFIKKSDYTNEVNHIDGDKSNNVIENLEWVTSKENCIKSVLTGLKPKTTKLSLEEVKKICFMIKEGLPVKEISAKFNVSKSCIKDIKQKISWKYISDGIF